MRIRLSNPPHLPADKLAQATKDAASGKLLIEHKELNRQSGDAFPKRKGR